jgi:GNAT superfamily N-acetyltransferase
VELRPARHDEKDALAELFVRAQATMAYLPPVPAEHLPRIAEIISGHEEVWVAEEHGRLLGFLAIDPSQRDGWEVLEKLYVEPNDQNRGVGTALLDKAKALRPEGPLPLGLSEERGCPAFLRSPRLPLGEAHRRRREHGARARRPLPVGALVGGIGVSISETTLMILGVPLTVVPSQGEADVICSMLRVEGIKCAERLADSIETSGNWREILVAESDLAAARELLDSAEA